ncbi:MAG: alpha-E domain-containing protein, partial [Candidatus Viridilinea halotolerans]
MLSRVADCLYWMSRYLERTEHTARLLSVGLTQTLGQNPAAAQPRWARILNALHSPTLLKLEADAYAITENLTFDADNESSLVACIALARENARQVREQISSEMWEHLNRLYLRMCTSSAEEIWQEGPIEFLQSVKEGAHLFQGITDATMSHDEGWYFIQVGRYIERTDATAMLLDTHFRPYLAAQPDEPPPLEFN